MTDVSLFGRTTRALAAVSSMLVMLTVLPAFAQPAGCDEGVIRLPDRNGTIQICSALAAQVPQLSRQLTEATRALGNQQAQIQELTKLVRGLNNAGQGLDATRQAAMLKNLSAELTRSQRGGDAQMQRSVQSLNEQLEALRDQFATMVGNAAAMTAVQQALRGEVGDSIAKLEFGSAARQLDEITTRLRAIQGQVGEVKVETGQIRKKVEKVDEKLVDIQKTLNAVKKETSEDPRKELANRGVQWNNDGFGEALMNADLSTLELFFSGGWSPLSAYQEGNAIGHFVYRSPVKDVRKVQAVISLLIQNGLDLNAKVVKFRGLPADVFAVNATEACNATALEAALKLGANKVAAVNAIKASGVIMPPTDGQVDCSSQILKISRLLGVNFIKRPRSAWDRDDRWNVEGRICKDILGKTMPC